MSIFPGNFFKDHILKCDCASVYMSCGYLEEYTDGEVCIIPLPLVDMLVDIRQTVMSMMGFPVNYRTHDHTVYVHTA